jgi:hypothetical protein
MMKAEENMSCKSVQLFGIVTLALLMRPTLVPAQGNVLAHFQVNGLEADYSSCDANNICPLFSIGANTSGTAGTQYFFFYSIYNYGNWPQVVVYDGFGQIPASAISITGDSQLVVVNIDSSQIPGFTNSTCTFDADTGDGTCSDAPGGPINVSWQKLRLYTRDGAGNSTSSLAPNFRAVQNFTFNNTAARGSGTIL